MSNVDPSLRGPPKKFSFQEGGNPIQPKGYNYFLTNNLLFPSNHKNSDYYPQHPNLNNQFGFLPITQNLCSMRFAPQITNINMNLFFSGRGTEVGNEGGDPLQVEKKEKEVINFDTLEELLAYLAKGKQIGNYIKCRKNTETMTNLIKKLPPAKIGELIGLVKNKLKDIMISNNKFSQKLFEQCTPDQRLLVLNIIKENFIDIALNKWGSFSLQALIKNISLPEEHELIKTCIKGKIGELALNKRSNFVLQKIISVLNDKAIIDLQEEIIILFDYLICNSLGISLLKTFIFTVKNADIRQNLIKKIAVKASTLINSVSGNALLLQLLEKFDVEINTELINEILKNIDAYSKNLFTYPLIEKCITLSNGKISKIIPESFYNSQSIIYLASTDKGRNLLYLLLSKLSKKLRSECLLTIKTKVEELKVNFGDNENLVHILLSFLEDFSL